MDEATSSVDLKTDEKIQKVIRAPGGLFSNSTILTIAHRLQTIIDYDYILVLDDGNAVEYGRPSELLEKHVDDPTAFFHRMILEMGPESYSRLRSLVKH